MLGPEIWIFKVKTKKAFQVPQSGTRLEVVILMHNEETKASESGVTWQVTETRQQPSTHSGAAQWTLGRQIKNCVLCGLYDASVLLFVVWCAFPRAGPSGVAWPSRLLMNAFLSQCTLLVTFHDKGIWLSESEMLIWRNCIKGFWFCPYP